VQEGKTAKFVNKVEQITFSGKYALEKGTIVTYVTERGVFQLEKEGLTLTEIAPGVDLQRDILDLMQFKPRVVASPKLMNPTIFSESKMNITD
jgi:propionate CoA-transferase